MFPLRQFLAAPVLLALASTCAADPAIVYEAVQFDDSFNVAAYDGIQRYKKEFGEAHQAFGAKSIRRFAEAGHEPVIAIGFTLSDEVARVAKDFPKTRFAIVDAVVSAPNVQSVVFKNQEGAFLVGMLAAMATKTGKAGFVGGMDVPVIRGFQCGYVHGVKYVNPRIEVTSHMTGTTPEAWSNPARGAELARQQFANGVDVVFAAAGGTGLGVYQAAKDAKKLAIGVDRNQNFLQPGTMLSSMIKRIDTAVYLTAKSLRDGSYTGGGVLTLGLKEQGVGWALDRHNRSLVTPDMQKKVEAAEADIIAGKLKVQEYVSGAGCKS
jgi:basic membrane protein A